MATTPVNYKLYRATPNDRYDFIPDLNATGSSYTAGQYTEGTNQEFMADYQSNKGYYDDYFARNTTPGVKEAFQQVISGSQAPINSGYVMNNGTLTTQSAINSDAANKAGVADGTQREISPGMYVPTGSAGDKLNAGIASGAVSPTNPQQQMAASMTGNNIANTGITPQAPDVAPQINTPANLAQAQASGQAPQSSADGRSAVNSYAPGLQMPTFYRPDPNSQQVHDSTGNPLSYDQYIAAGGKADFSNVQQGLPDTTGVDQVLSQDKGYQQLLKDAAEYNSVANQQKTLTDTYKDLTKELGIPALNTQLMNMKKVIDGTEDDLRSEITKAGGFATESQVQALTSARNKTLIQNYNNLLNVKNQSMDTLNTMLGLAEKDRSLAQQSILQKMQINQQLYEYQQKMKTNALSMYDNIVSKVGYQGLLAMTGGNAFYQGMIERTMGLPPGGLSKGAEIGNQKVAKSETKNLGTAKAPNWVRINYGAAGDIISRESLSGGGKTQSTQSSFSPRGNPAPKPSPTGNKLNEATAKLNSNLGKDGYTDPGVYMAIRDRLTPKELTTYDKQNKSKLSPAERKRLGL